MQPCPVRPSGSGQLSEVVRWMEREIRALQPIGAPGVLTSSGPRGVVRRPLGGGESGASPILTRMLVLNVLEDTLECSDTGGDTVTHTVYKPWHLRVSDYAAFDDAVLDAFETSNTVPGGNATIGEYAVPYLMRAGDDSGVLGSVRAVQQRYQLRYSSVDLSTPLPFGFGPKREVLQEAVWPPYYVSGGTGGAPGSYNGGGYDLFPYDSQWILAAQDNLGQWHEVVPSRQWVDVHSIIGDREVYVQDGYEFGRLINRNCSVNPGVEPRP